MAMKNLSEKTKRARLFSTLSMKTRFAWDAHLMSCHGSRFHRLW